MPRAQSFLRVEVAFPGTTVMLPAQSTQNRRFARETSIYTTVAGLGEPPNPRMNSQKSERKRCLVDVGRGATCLLPVK